MACPVVDRVPRWACLVHFFGFEQLSILTGRYSLWLVGRLQIQRIDAEHGHVETGVALIRNKWQEST
jgi:hypothetical protein